MQKKKYYNHETFYLNISSYENFKNVQSKNNQYAYSCLSTKFSL